MRKPFTADVYDTQIIRVGRKKTGMATNIHFTTYLRQLENYSGKQSGIVSRLVVPLA